MQYALTHRLSKQAIKLIKKIPEIRHWFVDIKASENRLIPFLPIGSFRQFQVFQSEEQAKTFLSSGSTNSVRATHSFSSDSLQYYEINTSRNFQAFLASLTLAADVPIISLVPTAAEWPQSSLAAMIEMFHKQGLNIHYFPELFPTLSNDLAIFGTSFHHIMLRNDPQYSNLLQLIEGKRLYVIDTGGTKGRTRAYTLDEVHQVISDTYKTAKECIPVSEYGMCELASQAWSLHAPHDGWFKTNTTLTPLVIDLHSRSLVKDPDKAGFLAFIDEGNIDSFSAIITEDIAMMSPDKPNCFKLVGRAPDASLKGCSLNVKSNFSPTGNRQKKSSPIIVNRKDPFEKLGSLPNSLTEKFWDSYALQDLENSLLTIRDPKVLQSRVGQKIAMVLSANIPITFLYPTFMAYFRGVSEVHLKIPSLRPSDPFSQRVRGQIMSLAQHIARFVYPMQIHIHNELDFNFDEFIGFDAVLIFGSDETVQLAKEAIKTKAGTEIIGLGSISNALGISLNESLGDIVRTCSLWFGRGCLTPAALICDFEFNAKEFAKVFEGEFSSRITASKIENTSAHKHGILAIEAFLKSENLGTDRIIKGLHTTVIDLRELDECLISKEKISLESAGYGLVFLVDETLINILRIDNYPCNPGFLDPHMGKLWSHWL